MEMPIVEFRNRTHKIRMNAITALACPIAAIYSPGRVYLDALFKIECLAEDLAEQGVLKRAGEEGNPVDTYQVRTVLGTFNILTLEEEAVHMGQIANRMIDEYGLRRQAA